MLKKITLMCAFLLAPTVRARPTDVLIDLPDPAGDSDGPGTYTPPSDADLQGAEFDLRRFVARVDGDDLVLEVTLGETIKAPGSAWRTNTTAAQLTNGIYLQNIDIYVDTDPSPAGRGVSVSIPGRRVGFAEGRTWKRAVVMTPQPAAVASLIEGALGEAAWRVTIPPVSSRGKTAIARVPLAFFGSKPRPDWGWSVQLSGAAWERNFAVVDQLRGTAKADALTMPVSTTAERWAFGGAELGRAHPQVVDIIVPAGVDQHAILAQFNNETGEFARVPFVYGKPPPLAPMSELVPAEPAKASAQPPSTPPPPKVGWSVVDVAGEIVSIQGATAGVTPMMFGQVVDDQGVVVARVVVMQVLPSGIVASAVDNREKIARGATVRFAVKPKESQ